MKIINFAILLIFLVSLPVYAQEETETTTEVEDTEVEQVLEETTEEVGITPDKAGYGLKLAIEKLRLVLTFNRAKKAEFRLKLAENRLREAALMARLNKLEALERAKNEHTRLIQEVKLDIEALEDGEEALETQTELESKIEENEARIEEIESTILIKAKGLTEEQQAKLLALLEEFKQGNQDVKLKIVSKKDIIKTRLKAQGLKEEEIEIKIKERKEKLEVNLERKAQHQIDQATKMFELASRLIEKAQTEKNVTISHETLDLKANAETKLNEANTALTDKEFRKAIELARESKKLSALTIASIRGGGEKFREKLRERVEEELEEENEIKVEIKRNRAKVEVEVNGIESKFVLETTDKKEIIAEIAARTGLTTAEIEEIIEFEEKELEDEEELEEETETEEETELEIEAEVGFYGTNVKVEINDKKERFTLEATTREEVIAKIAERYGLTIEEVQEVIEFK